MQKPGPPTAAAAAAPTGCFKCGRPGHWSRDCPSSPATNPNSNPNPNPKTTPFSSSKFTPRTPLEKAPAAKKVPKTRPKLTPELLLSDDGLGYVLRHFPRNFKYHGPGHEVADLGNLIGMYAQWHSRLIPYYSFDQFVHKVEPVASSKRVRRCVQELKERVARGGDPTKLHEPKVEQVPPECEGAEEDVAMAKPVGNNDNPPLESHEASDTHEEMLDEIFWKATEVASEVPSDMTSAEVTPEKRSVEQAMKAADQISSKPQVTEEQLERMEANRLKALGRAPSDMASAEVTPEKRSVEQAMKAADEISSKPQITEEQLARMEANRLKALERAAARERSSSVP